MGVSAARVYYNRNLAISIQRYLRVHLINLVIAGVLRAPQSVQSRQAVSICWLLYIINELNAINVLQHTSKNRLHGVCTDRR